MKCKIISFKKVNRGSKLPYFIIKAKEIRDKDGYDLLNEDEPNFSYMSPPSIFEKKLFPNTEVQVKELESLCKTDKNGRIIGEAPFIRLMSYKWMTPFSFYIINSNSKTGVYETREEISEDIVDYVGDEMVIVKEIKYIPKIFNSINVILLETKDGKCAENDGDADGLCKIAFQNAVESGLYLMKESATHIKEVIDIEEVYKKEERNNKRNYDEWREYSNNEYYNDGLDMDQQDERFWNF